MDANSNNNIDTSEEQNTLEMQKINATVNSALYFKKKPVFAFFKRFFDIINSTFAIILLSPLLLIIALIVKFTSKGPVLYRHKRIGKNGRPFSMLKFRTMKWDKRPIEEQLTKEQLEQFYREFKVDNDPRITKIGKFLRKTSLDELPQLWDIFVGRMSVVGPRSPIPCEVEKYNEYQMHRLDVKGGLLCLWQIQKNRNSISFDDWVKLDIEYAKKRSLWLDFKIIVKGAWMVIFDHSGE